jgi:ribonuclease T2
MLRLALTTLLFSLLVPLAQGETRLKGELIAEQACPALQSIRKNTNPGGVTLQPGMAYPVFAGNRSEPTHYRLRVPGANPVERWVAVGCGRLLTNCTVTQGGAVEPGAAPDYVLAVSWQPAFCQTHQSKAECRAQTEDRFDATHFTLHGLWPQPRGNDYCGVSGENKRLDKDKAWGRLPPLGLSEETMARLEVAMPGVASNLQRHEWIKHGTCYGKPSEEYINDALALLQQLNDSPVRELFADNIGSHVSAAVIRQGLEQTFGTGARDKITLNCKDGMITELQLHLRGEIQHDTPLGDLLQDAPTARLRCAGGRVDAVGF